MMDQANRKFNPPENAIKSQADIVITAPPERVAAVYKDVEKWGEIYPATIESARVVEAGNNWQQVEVQHKSEGCVPNTLFFLSDHEIGLWESKGKFDASFLNRFEPVPGGATRFVITSYVSLKGIYKLLKPFLVGYVHRSSLHQMRNYVLKPIKKAAEQGYTKRPNRKQ